MCFKFSHFLLALQAQTGNFSKSIASHQRCTYWAALELFGLISGFIPAHGTPKFSVYMVPSDCFAKSPIFFFRFPVPTYHWRNVGGGEPLNHANGIDKSGLCNLYFIISPPSSVWCFKPRHRFSKLILRKLSFDALRHFVLLSAQPRRLHG